MNPNKHRKLLPLIKANYEDKLISKYMERSKTSSYKKLFKIRKSHTFA